MGVAVGGCRRVRHRDGGGATPLAHFFDWLAEWAREARRRQTGLLLLTAHRAKGLEFDHVVVLDGDWDKRDAASDANAPRRLHYVAMTRARQTLALARCGAGGRLWDALIGSLCAQARTDGARAELSAEVSRLYRRPPLSDIDIGFAGRFVAANPVHGAIASLRIGEPLDLRNTAGHWELVDRSGRTVGRFARAFQVPANHRCLHASVAAVIVRRRQDTAEDYLSSVRCEEWEVVMPDLVFAPA